MSQLNENMSVLKNNSDEWNLRNKNVLQVGKHEPYVENYMLIGYNYMANRHNYDPSMENVIHHYVGDPYKYYNNEPDRNNCIKEIKEDSDESNGTSSPNSVHFVGNQNSIKYNPNMLLQIELNTNDQNYDNGSRLREQPPLAIDNAAKQQQPKSFKETGTQCDDGTRIECAPNIDSFVGVDPNTGAPGTKVNNHLSYHEINFHRLARSLSETTIYKCNICDKEFLHKNYLDSHLRAHNGQKSRLRTCDYCDCSFTNKRKHYEHFKTHFNDQSYNCLLCNASFVTEIYLKEHVKLHSATLLFPDKMVNNINKERIFPCSFCNRVYNNRSSVMFHLRLHTSEIVFRCSYCNKSFLNKSELNLHIRIHTGNKTHSCEICHKLFLTTSNLKQHLRFHTGDKPYSCSNCEKCFSNRSNLMQHMKVHTGDKPHHCTFCEKSFTTTSNLTQHIRIHTGDKPYLCNYCGKAFINNSNLSQHVKVHCPSVTGKPKKCKKMDQQVQSQMSQPPPPQAPPSRPNQQQSAQVPPPTQLQTLQTQPAPPPQQNPTRQSPHQPSAPPPLQQTQQQPGQQLQYQQIQQLTPFANNNTVFAYGGSVGAPSPNVKQGNLQ